jgi:signal transduction histidine kinase
MDVTDPVNVDALVIDEIATGSRTQSSRREAEIDIRRDERDRIAREVHDTTSQLLVVLDLQIMSLRRNSCAADPHMDAILADMSDTVADLHRQVRTVAEPQEFDPGALTQSLETMAAEFAARAKFAIVTRIDELPLGIPPRVAETLFRVAQEALANASRHSRAENVGLWVTVDHDAIVLQVSDDGIGFAHPTKPLGGCGIANMRARTKAAGGKLSIRNLGHGALVEARFDPAPHSESTPRLFFNTV